MTITQIKETCLYVADIERTFEFYHQKLGLPLISKVATRHVFFRAGSSVLLCFLPEITKNDIVLPPHFAYGKQHIAFEIPIGEYAIYKSQLINNQIEIIHEHLWPNGLNSFYFEDPDKHVLEILPEKFWDTL